MHALKKTSQAHDLAKALGRGKHQVIKDGYRTFCPACDNDLHPMLVVIEGVETPRVKCLSGCSAEQIRKWTIVSLSEQKNTTPVTSITREDRIKRSLIAITAYVDEIGHIVMVWIEWQIKELTSR